MTKKKMVILCLLQTSFIFSIMMTTEANPIETGISLNKDQTKLVRGVRPQLICSLTHRKQVNFTLTPSLATELTNFCDYFMFYSVQLDLNYALMTSEEDDRILNTFVGYDEAVKMLLFVYNPSSRENTDKMHENSSKLIQLMIQQLRTYKFHGIVLYDGFVTEEYTTSTKFFQDFRNAIDQEAEVSQQPKLILAFNSESDQERISEYYNIEEIAEYVDFVFIHTFNLFSENSNRLSHYQPLYDIPWDDTQVQKHEINYAVNNAISLKIPKNKIFIHLPAEGRAYIIKDAKNPHIGALFDYRDDTSEFPSSNYGYVPFIEICKKLRNEKGWTVRHFNKSMMGPYAYRKKNWISFDEPATSELKTKYIIDKHLRGAIIDISSDDYVGNCYDKTYPLMKAIKLTMLTYTSKNSEEDEVMDNDEMTVYRDAENANEEEGEHEYEDINSNTCPELNTENMDITCYQNKRKTPCTDSLTSGTTVEPKCKDFYHKKNNATAYQTIKCIGGEWDHDLFKCVPKCGQLANPVQTLISKGEKVAFGEAPWNVAIYEVHNNKDINLICSGTIITPRIIISAAHCFYDEGHRKQRSPNSFRLTVAKQTRNFEIEDNKFQKNYEIREIRFVDKGFFGSRANYASDIALLITKVKIQLNVAVLPICIDLTLTEVDQEEGASGKVVGWGQTDSQDFSDTLLYAELPYISYGKCYQVIGEDVQSYISVDKFCAGRANGPNVGKGDSGSGLIFYDLNSNTYQIQGIASLKGIKADSSIAMFTDVNYYSKWIARVIENIEAESE